MSDEAKTVGVLGAVWLATRLRLATLPAGTTWRHLLGLAISAGIGFTVWKVSTARRMARDAGMDEGDATAMTLLSDDGFEATYLASNLRRPATPPPAGAPPGAADRLRELQALLDQGLINQAEYDDRRRAVIDNL